jgi:cytosine/adenosine deaminase-related metal-dependent hydrolase
MGPAGVLDRGAVYVDDGAVEAVQPDAAPPPDPKYRGAPRIRTGDTIFPGFVELHNHLSYNAMPLWDVPTRYTNNGQWRGIEPYTRRITKPSQVLGQTDGVAQALVRYAESRALLGGTTTSQGITLASAGGLTKYYAGLIRNAESPDDRRLPPASTKIANPASGDAAGYLRALEKNTCYLQHLSEGTDPTARSWFHRLRIDHDTWAVNRALCAIHCAALEPEDFAVLAERGAAMVWSPLSNFLLYGRTADIAAAKASGISMSLGSDWAPSGSKNLLGELKVAWLTSREHGDVFTPRELVEMVTVNPARALAWDSLLGTIEPGKLADLVVVNGQGGDPYELLLGARESSITLVTIGGVPRVGQPRLMRRFWDDPVTRVDWIDKIRIGRSSRMLFLEHEHDLLGGLHLSDAVATLAEAMERLPQLAQQVDDAVGLGNVLTAGGAVTFAGGMSAGGETLRVVPDFEEEDTAHLIDALGFAMAAQPYSFWVTEPMALDPVTVVDDREHLRSLLRSRNLPEFVKRGLPGLYGETIPVPDSASFLTTGGPVDPQLLGTTTDLRTLLASFGELTLDDRKRIVAQALVLLTDNYVHLPLKRAMHAVDPVQQLRLLRQQLDETTPETMPPEIKFHAEVTAIFNSLRDLHTGYRLPAPFGTKVAWLPFLLEEVWDRGERCYLLTKWVLGAWPEPAMEGARVTHWNGMPIETAVARNADRNAGSNLDARHARGLNSMTIRPLALGLPPDEDWIALRWLDGAGSSHELTQEWLVFEPGATTGPGQLLVESSAIGVDDHTDDIQQARKILFAPAVAAAERQAADQVLDIAIGDTMAGLESFMPGVFRAMEVRRSGAGDDDPSYGYIRIFTFNVTSADAFVDEFVRLARLLPDHGLIIDVRGNGGGLIYAAERLLQVLTPRQIEPESAQFISTPLNLRICRNHRQSTTLAGLALGPWVESIEQSTRTGATFSRAVPITTPADANRIGQTYHGPVVLITDALCYSATDMFAAGYQDHQIGAVIGVGGATGAGGANVWSHALLRKLMEPDNEDPGPSPYEPLARGADLRVAVRRTTRVGPNAGNVLEDLGVTPDVHYRMTREDVMGHNQDLIDRAVDQLAARRPHLITVERVRRHQDRAPSVVLRTRNITRVDAEADGRRLHTRDVRRNRVVLDLDEVVTRRSGEDVQLQVTGFDGDVLAAVLRQPIGFAGPGGAR